MSIEAWSHFVPTASPLATLALSTQTPLDHGRVWVIVWVLDAFSRLNKYKMILYFNKWKSFIIQKINFFWKSTQPICTEPNSPKGRHWHVSSFFYAQATPPPPRRLSQAFPFWPVAGPRVASSKSPAPSLCSCCISILQRIFKQSQLPLTGSGLSSHVNSAAFMPFILS